MVPDASAASRTLIHVDRVAVRWIEERMRKVGKRRAMRTAPPLMIDEEFARKFVELSHDYHPRLPTRLGWAA